MLCVAILSCAIAFAVDGTGAPGAPGATSAWRIDAGVALLREAWDFNESTESIAGLIVGADRHMWKGLSLRGELLALRVRQEPEHAWLRGVTVGTRLRWGKAQVRPVVDVAVGLSDATSPVPPNGTASNYLAVIGAGVEAPLGAVLVAVTGRWLHASNNGREGRHNNPDLQSLGAIVSVGWGY